MKSGNVNRPLTYGVDFEIAGYENNVNKGTAKVILRGIGKFGGEKTVTFKIGQRNVLTNWLKSVNVK